MYNLRKIFSYPPLLITYLFLLSTLCIETDNINLIDLSLQPFQAQAQEFISNLDPQKLYQKRVQAVLKITVFDKKSFGLYSLGTGTIISKDGLILTNLHLAQYFYSQDYLMSISQYDETYLKSVKIIACSDQRQIDLCLLKADFQAKAWFPILSFRPTLGHTVYKIGNGGGEDFNLTKGYTVSKEDNLPFLFNYMTNENRNVEFLEVSATLMPGDSGGPVYDEQGKLIGINTLSIISSQSPYNPRYRPHPSYSSFSPSPPPQRYMVISSSEIKRYLEKHQDLIKAASEGTSGAPEIKLLSKEEIALLHRMKVKSEGPPDKIPLIKNINTPELYQLLSQRKNPSDILVIDLRDPISYQLGHLPEAINLHYVENSKKSPDFVMILDQFDLNYIKKHARPETKIIVYCEGESSWKSYKALRTIQEKTNFENLYWFRQ